MNIKNSKLVSMLVVLLVSSLTNAARAQANPPPAAGNEPQTLDRNYQNKTSEEVPSTINKASSLLGMAVHTPDREKLGKVDDVVFDATSGRVAYVVVGSGGILGIDEKRVAVPLSAFTPSADSSTLVLNTTKDRLQMAQGLKPGHWPSINTTSWGAERFWESPQGRDMSLIDHNKTRVGKSESSANQAPSSVSQNTAANESNGGEPAKIDRAHYVYGMEVKDPQGERLGKISDIVFDLKRDEVSYTVLSTENPSGLSLHRRMIAVPITAYVPSPEGNSLVLNTTRAKVEAAPGFSNENWPSVNHPDFGPNPIWQQSSSTPSAPREPNLQQPNTRPAPPRQQKY